MLVWKKGEDEHLSSRNALKHNAEVTLSSTPSLKALCLNFAKVKSQECEAFQPEKKVKLREKSMETIERLRKGRIKDLRIRMGITAM